MRGIGHLLRITIFKICVVCANDGTQIQKFFPPRRKVAKFREKRW
jgi:hypothetical protein